MKKVLVTQSIHQAGLELLEGKAEVIISPDPSGETIKKLVSDVHGILLRTTSKITKDIILAAQTLEVISRTGAGDRGIDQGLAGFSS